jgi:hypothetical protein
MPLTSPYADRREEIVARVIEGLRKGTPLTVICSQPDMPCDDTVRNWADADESLARAIARAREAGFDAIALEALAIADDKASDTKISKDGQEVPDTEWISRSRLRVETRLKLLAKWDPRRYGEMTKIANADGTNIEPREVTDVDLATRLAALAAANNRSADAAD